MSQYPDLLRLRIQFDKPLFYAIKKGRSLMVQCLLKHDPDIFEVDDNGENILHLAVRSKSLATVKAVLREWPKWKLYDAAPTLWRRKTALDIARRLKLPEIAHQIELKEGVLESFCLLEKDAREL
ncbi:ankyrin repeat domain-containing protein [Parashewanella curva]|uniref:ankyrin repeat domain-containing protein n=1 Tax=Parashewanella curva TaxID=2338552 RepID=UPI0014045884|nr:ankyrin repeat domain-containing protein [Parashewanella curva]